jgi:hypothetical protein
MYGRSKWINKLKICAFVLWSLYKFTPCDIITCYTEATESISPFLHLPLVVIPPPIYFLAISYSVCSGAGSDNQVIMVFSTHQCSSLYRPMEAGRVYCIGRSGNHLALSSST